MDLCPTDAADELQQRLIQAYANEGVPFSVHVDLTHRCDLRCRHCYLEERVPDGLDTEAWRRVFDDLAAMKVFQLIVSGGEPLLRGDLLPLLDHARALRFGVVLKTHGGLVDVDVAARLKVAGVKRVDVSVYALAAEIHDGVTGRDGSLTSTLRGIAHLRAAGLPVRISCPVMAANAPLVAELAKWAAEEGLGFLPSPGLLPGNQGEDLDARLGLDEDGLDDFVALERSLHGARANQTPTDDEPLCGAGWFGAYIGAAGDARPCSMWPEAAGDVRHTPFSTLWREAKVFREARALRHAARAACHDCRLRGFCTPCPARSLHAVGDATAPAPFDCRLAAKRAEKGAP